MSVLAKKIATTKVSANAFRRGPANLCHPIYGDGDLEDWTALEALRTKGLTWREVQAHIDGILGVTRPLSVDKFRYHWRRRCFCWASQGLQL